MASARVTRPPSAASSGVCWIRSRLMMMRSSGLMKRLRSCSARPAFDPPVSSDVVWLLAVPGFVPLLGDGALDLGVDLRPRALPERPDDDLGAGISFLSL